MKQTAGLSVRRAVWMAAVLTLVGAVLAWRLVSWTDRGMRADLLQQTRLVAETLEITRVQALTGTQADLDNPYYQRFKEQFFAASSANPLCRFFYLMGRKADGTVYILVDSEPPDSKDYSPPGQVYNEVSEGIRRAFDSKFGTVEGPVADRWGVWISALVPIRSPQTGDVLAVLGMDIDARVWKWDVAARAALPMGLLLVLLIGVAAILFISARRVNAAPKPVLRRLLPYLTVIVLLLLPRYVTML